MPNIDSNGLPVVSTNALHYKQLHDDAVKGYHSTVLGGIGARLGWKHGRKLLGKGLQKFKSKDPNSKGFISGIGNRIGSAGDYLVNDDRNRTARQRVIQGLLDAGFGIGGLSAGARVGSNFTAPIQLGIEEGTGAGTSSKNIQSTYDKLFGSLTPSQQAATLREIERYNTAVYGTDKKHSGLNKTMNVIAGIGGSGVGEFASNKIIDSVGLRNNNTLTGKALKGGILALGNLLGSSAGISATTAAYRNLHGDSIAPIPFDYYAPNAYNSTPYVTVGRATNSLLNTAIPGRIFSHPDQVQIEDGKNIVSMHRDHVDSVIRNRDKYRKGIGRYTKSLSNLLTNTINKPIDTIMGQDTDINPYN